jgi:hypothetical protein
MRKLIASWEADTPDFFPALFRVETVGTHVQITVREAESEHGSDGYTVAVRMPAGALGHVIAQLVANWPFPEPTAKVATLRKVK